MILANHGIIQSKRSASSGGITDPYAANIVLFLKGNQSGLTTNTTTTASFTVPDVNSTLVINVASSDSVAANRAIRIGGSAGNYIITAVPNSTQIIVRNCGGTNNASPGTTISSGATIALSIIDSSPNPKAVTAFGNAQISTANSKHDDSSLYFDGTGGYLSVVSSEFSFGTGDFTIEFWSKSEDVSLSRQRGFYQQSTITNGLSTSYSNSIATLQGASGNVGNTGGITSVFNSVFTGAANQTNTSNWFHIAVSRVSGVSRTFVNGVLISSITDTSDYTGTNLAVGGYYNTAYLYQGFLDSFRATKAGRYTANFNPETDTYLNI
jgi:hypothetical protein